MHVPLFWVRAFGAVYIAFLLCYKKSAGEKFRAVDICCVLNHCLIFALSVFALYSFGHCRRYLLYLDLARHRLLWLQLTNHLEMSNNRIAMVMIKTMMMQNVKATVRITKPKSNPLKSWNNMNYGNYLIWQPKLTRLGREWDLVFFFTRRFLLGELNLVWWNGRGSAVVVGELTRLYPLHYDLPTLSKVLSLGGCFDRGGGGGE